MKVNVLEIRPRTNTGKGIARKLRREGRVPAVAYSRGKTTDVFDLDPVELLKILRKRGRNSSLSLQFSDGRPELSVMLKDLQRDPLTQSILHVDFIHIDTDKALQVRVPLVYTGRPIGTQFGGIIDTVRRDLLISALPANIPRQIEVDISHLQLNQTLHIGDLRPFAGVDIIDDPKFALLNIAVPSGAKEATEAEGEATEEAPPAAAAKKT